MNPIQPRPTDPPPLARPQRRRRVRRRADEPDRRRRKLPDHSHELEEKESLVHSTRSLHQLLRHRSSHARPSTLLHELHSNVEHTITRSRKCITVDRFDGSITALASNSDYSQIAIACKDHAVYIYDQTNGKFSRRHRLVRHRGTVWALEYHPRARHVLVSVDSQGDLVLWNSESGLVYGHQPGHGTLSESVCFHPDLNIILCVRGNVLYHVWYDDRMLDPVFDVPSQTALPQFYGAELVLPEASTCVLRRVTLCQTGDVLIVSMQEVAPLSLLTPLGRLERYQNDTVSKAMIGAYQCTYDVPNRTIVARAIGSLDGVTNGRFVLTSKQDKLLCVKDTKITLVHLNRWASLIQGASIQGTLGSVVSHSFPFFDDISTFCFSNTGDYIIVGCSIKSIRDAMDSLPDFEAPCFPHLVVFGPGRQLKRAAMLYENPMGPGEVNCVLATNTAWLYGTNAGQVVAFVPDRD